MGVYYFLNSLIILKVHNKLLGKSRLYSLHFLQIPLYFLKTHPSRTQSWHFLSLCTSRCLLSFSPFLFFPSSAFPILPSFILFFLPYPRSPSATPSPGRQPFPLLVPPLFPGKPETRDPELPSMERSGSGQEWMSQRSQK